MAIIRLIMLLLIVYLVITIAAFVYLEWWQAILASLGTLLVMGYGVRWLALAALGRLTGVARDLFEIKSRVLRGASIQVHSVKPVEPPRHFADPSDDPESDETEEDRAAYLAEIEAQNWYEIEATIFPAPNAPGPMQHWDVYDLQLVPHDAKEPNLFGIATGEEEDDDEDHGINEVAVMVNGEPRDPEDGKLKGPQRLWLLAGFPKHVHAVKFRYYFEHFGHIALPKSPALPA